MAEVLLGWGPAGEGDSLVAIKVMLPQFAAEREFQEMFLDEARLSTLVNHPNVVRIYDLGIENERLYLVSEYVRGCSTSVLLKRLAATGERLHPRQAAVIVMQAAAGLHAAHQTRDPKGRFLSLVHRDVSPQNLLLSQAGEIKVVDFGVAKANYRLSETMTNVVKGKVGYMSPEQARGNRVDRRSDIFSLGLVLYELATGTRALGGESDNEVAAALAALTEGHVKLDLDRPEIPPRLRRAVTRAVEVDPERRYASAGEMQSDLVPFVGQLYERTVEELGALSAKYSPRLPGTKSEAKKLLLPVYELSVGPGDARAQPVRRVTRDQVIFYASALAGVSLTVGMILGSYLVTRSVHELYRDRFGIQAIGLGGEEEAGIVRGELVVVSLPDARVEIDGRDYGNTPQRLRVEVGRHRVVARVRTGGQTYTRGVEAFVPPNGTVTKRFELRGSLLYDVAELERLERQGRLPQPSP